MVRWNRSFDLYQSMSSRKIVKIVLFCNGNSLFEIAADGNGSTDCAVEMLRRFVPVISSPYFSGSGLSPSL
jgi:hypothetical protein